MRSVDMEEMGVGRAADYVFRIIYPGHRHEHSEYLKLHHGGGEKDAQGGGGVQRHPGGAAGRVH